MPSRLSPLQRAYLMGYRRAKAQMRRELEEMAERFSDEIDEVRAEMSRAVDDMGDRLNDAVDEVHVELVRWREIDRAIDAERDPDMLLN